MQTVRVPIFQPVYTGVDDVELSEGSFSLTDGYRSDLGATIARPGSESIVTAGAIAGRPVSGLYYWSEKNQVVAVSDGKVITLNNANGSISWTARTSSRIFDPTHPATFATDGDRCFIAAGGSLRYIEETGGVSALTDGDAPTDVTHVAYLDGYILANSRGTNRFHFSEVNSSLSWNALSFASGAGSPDLISGLYVYNREVYLFGKRSVEIWENDGSTPFSRVPGGFIDAGCAAPYSVVISDNQLYWIDDQRRLVYYDGKGVTAVQNPFDTEVHDLYDISDCRGMKISYERTPFLVFTFPKANKTFTFNKLVSEWSVWGKWNQEKADYDRWVGNCHCYAELWGMHLIGRRDKEVVAHFHKNYADDDGDVIRLARVTGSIDYGTLKQKRGDEFRIRCRRGDGISSRVPRLVVRFCDDGVWKQPRYIQLGDVGQYDMVARIFRTGIYRTRKYEFVATDPVRIVFAGAEEDIEVLR